MITNANRITIDQLINNNNDDGKARFDRKNVQMERNRKRSRIFSERKSPLRA